MSKEQTDLLPCPFCGGDGLEFHYHDIDGWVAHVRCLACDDMCGPMSEFKYQSKAEAAQDASDRWNRRASPSPAGGVQGVTEDMVERARQAWPKTWEPYDLGNALRAALKAALSSQAQTTGGVDA